MKIVALDKEHLEAAAELVRARYRALRERLPVMPARYEQSEVILGMLRDLLGEAGGVAAVRDGRLVGFLMGLTIPEFMGKRSAYSPEWMNGAALGQSQRVYEEMYGVLSRRWVDDGCYLHLVSMLASDPQGVEALKWQGFGLINVDGVRALEPVEGEQAAGVEVRQASGADAADVSAMGKALERHVASAPTFFIHDLEDFGERVGQRDYPAWLANRAGESLGFIALEPGENCDSAILRDERTVHVCGAYTKEEVRGNGIATQLLNQALAWAQAQGYSRCAVDFETANSLAARFWMRWFAPVNYSLMRWVDERVRG